MKKTLQKLQWARAELIALAIGAALYILYRGLIWLCPNWAKAHIAAPLMGALGAISDKLPWGITQWVIVAFFVAALGLAVWYVAKIITRRGQRAGYACRLGAAAVAIVLLVYCGYCYLWGLNYYDKDFAAREGLTRQPTSATTLYNACVYFANLCNQTACDMPQKQDILQQAEQIWQQNSTMFDTLLPDRHTVKGLPASALLSKIGYSGFYFPFTGEANVNTHMPATDLPCTALHELAHKSGVAAEDEANFVAIVLCLNSQNSAFVYSGALTGYTYLINQLYQTDYELWQKAAVINDRVYSDLMEQVDYWQEQQSPAEEVADQVYEGFLQSFSQSEGLNTYSLVVDLLLCNPEYWQQTN